MLKSAILLALTVAGVTEAAERPWPPQASEAPIFLVVERLFWRPALPGLPEAVKFAALEGNPSAAGPFTLRLSIPANTKIAPLSLGHEYRLTVLTGSLYVGFGAQYDESQFKELPAGGFWACPAWHITALFTRQDTVVQISSIGPWEVKYSNPQDDPRRRTLSWSR